MATLNTFQRIGVWNSRGEKKLVDHLVPSPQLADEGTKFRRNFPKVKQLSYLMN